MSFKLAIDTKQLSLADAVDDLMSFIPYQNEQDVHALIAHIVELSGGTIDMCSLCGASPMTANCNNAGCDV